MAGTAQSQAPIVLAQHPQTLAEGCPARVAGCKFPQGPCLVGVRACSLQAAAAEALRDLEAAGLKDCNAAAVLSRALQSSAGREKTYSINEDSLADALAKLLSQFKRANPGIYNADYEFTDDSKVNISIPRPKARAKGSAGSVP